MPHISVCLRFHPCCGGWADGTCLSEGGRDADFSPVDRLLAGAGHRVLEEPLQGRLRHQQQTGHEHRGHQGQHHPAGDVPAVGITGAEPVPQRGQRVGEDAEQGAATSRILPVRLTVRESSRSA